MSHGDARKAAREADVGTRRRFCARQAHLWNQQLMVAMTTVIFGSFDNINIITQELRNSV